MLFLGSAMKQSPGQILISARVLTKVENAVTVEPAGEFTLKSIRHPMMAYNVVTTKARALNNDPLYQRI